MKMPEPAIRVGVDACNPGQYFACCGLLELAHRMWGGAEGWFADVTTFCIAPSAPTDATPAGLVAALADCRLTNVMTEEQLSRRDTLGRKKKKDLTEAEEDEKKALAGLWRELPLLLHEPFGLRLDWWLDERAGGNRYKTWAGQQSVIDMASDLKALVVAGDYPNVAPADWLQKRAAQGGGFNFDAELGAQSSALDVGFSTDPLIGAGVKVGTRSRPLLELAALVGLQRFHPDAPEDENRHAYALWGTPMYPAAASLAATGRMGIAAWPLFEFRLLFRTKYLKSFLPAQPREVTHE